MNAIHNLTVKTAAAASRLASLEMKRAKVDGGASKLVGTAVDELQDALEELRVAIDQLQELHDARATAVAEEHRAIARYDELFNIVPSPMVFTDDSGRIVAANGAAARLFNLSPRYLVGKGLVLYFAERDRFLALLRQAERDDRVSEEFTVRPRDRKSRALQVSGHFLKHHGQWCWLFAGGGGKQSVCSGRGILGHRSDDVFLS